MRSYAAILRKRPRVIDVLKNSSIYVLIVGTFVLHFSHTSLSRWYIRPIAAVYGLMICKALLLLMLSHVTSQKFYPFRVSVILSCTIVIAYLFTPLNSVVSEEFAVWSLLCFNFLGNLRNNCSLRSSCV